MRPDDVSKIAAALKAGQVGVMPTDTIYGVAGRADMPDVVERIYAAKGRTSAKPFVILIADIEDLAGLKITLSQKQIEVLHELWPAAISVILSCPDATMDYLHRGLCSLAVRLPEPVWLRELVRLSGPLVATSANKSGQIPSTDIEIIKKQLPGLDFYVEGPSDTSPSRLMRMQDNGQLFPIKRS